MAVHWERFDLEGKLELEVAVRYYSFLTLADLESDLEHYKLLELVVAVVVAALMDTGYHK